MTTTVALVACGAAKTPHASPAAELYTGDLFRKSRAYAEHVADRWYVLSAEHGLLHPAAVVAPYDRTLNAMTAAERAAWTDSVWDDLDGRFGPAPVRFVVLAGRRYREGLLPLMAAAGHDVEVPLAGLGIGQQKARLLSLVAA